MDGGGELDLGGVRDAVRIVCRPDDELAAAVDPFPVELLLKLAGERFKRGEASFTGIWRIIEGVMSRHKPLERPSLDAILKADLWARETAAAFQL